MMWLAAMMGLAALIGAAIPGRRARALALTGLVAVLAAASASPAGAQAQAGPLLQDEAGQPEVLRARYRPEQRRLLLVWPRPVPLQVEHGAGEIVIRSPVPIDAQALGAVAPTLLPWVASVSWGYDSLLLELAQGTGSQVARHPDGVAVTFGPAPGATAPRPGLAQLPAEDVVMVQPPDAPPSAAGDAEIRRHLLLARADLLDGDPGAAEARSQALLRHYPDRRDVLDTAADAAAQAGDWREAVVLYERLRQLTPANVGYIRAAREARRLYGNRFTIAGYVQDVRGADRQRGAEAELRVQPLPRWTLLARAWLRHLEGDNVLQPDGQVLAYSGNRSEGAVEAVYRHSTDWTFAGSFLVNPRGVGAAARIAHGPPTRRTILEAALNQPDTVFVETLASQGTRDRLALGYSRTVGQALTVQVGADYIAYSLADDADVARSAGLQAQLDHVLAQELFAGGPYAVASYRFDGSWVLESQERVDAQGQSFNPLPIVSREVNTLSLGLFGWLSQDTDYGLQVGYSYDRLNGHGPDGALQFRYQPNDTLEFFGDATYGLSTGRGDDATVLRAGLGMAVNF